MVLESSESNKILNVIDFVNHHYGGFIKITGEFSCNSCDEKFPEGAFRYSKGGYIPGPDVLNLSVESMGFPLHNLHRIHTFNVSEETDEVISQLFYKSSDWNFYNVPENCFDEYLKIMEVSSLLSLYSLEANHWHNAVHTTPNFTEEEMLKDPGKRKIMEIEGGLNSRPKKLESRVKSEVDFVFKEIIGDKKVPLIYVVKEEHKQSIEDKYYKLSFIENTYESLKAQNIFFPNEKRSSIIKAIDSCFEEVDLGHKNNPSPF